MLHEIIYWLPSMSIAASVAGLAVMLLRKIRRIPRRIAVIMWAAPFVRMCIPVAFNSTYSLASLLSRLVENSYVSYQPYNGLPVSIMNYLQAAEAYDPLTYKNGVLQRVFEWAGIIWLAGFAAIALTLVLVYCTTVREMRDAKPGGAGVYYSNKVTTPAVYGIFRQKIVLPYSYAGRDNSLVLLHERAHLRRRDNIVRVVALMITAAHWFNPLAWVFLKRLYADIELACDEAVLAEIGERRAKEYARCLLEAKEGMGVFVSSLGGGAIRTRIENVLSFKRLTWLSLLCSAALIAVILATLLTNSG